MKLHGHLVEIDWDGSVLVARGTNADGRELVNAGTDDNRLVLTAADIDTVVFRDAPRMVGGVLRVVDVSGAEHRLHFRRDTRSEFHRLHDELSAAVDAARSQRVHHDDPESNDDDPGTNDDDPGTTDDDPEPTGVVDLTTRVWAGPHPVDPKGHDAVPV